MTSPFTPTVEVRYCRLCQRDTPQDNGHLCLDATDWECTVCGCHDVVPSEEVTYSTSKGPTK